MHIFKQAGKRILLSIEVTHTLEQQRAAFLSGVFMLLTFFSAFQVVVQDLILQADDPLLRTLRFLGVVLTLPLYLLSRRGYYRIAGRIFVILALGFLIGGVWLATPNQNSLGTLYFLILPLLVAGLALSYYESIMYLAVICIAVVGLNNLHPEINIRVVPVLTLFMAVGLTMISLSWFTISFQKRSEANEQRYLDLIDASLEAIIIIDTHDARILDMNTVFSNLVGLPREKIRGRYPVEFLNLESKVIAREMFRTMDQNPQEMEVLRSDGTQAYIEAMLRPHVYSGKPALVIVMRDVTARRLAERALQESERLFRAIFDNSFQFAGVTTPDGTIQEMNSATMRFFQLQHQDVVGEKLWDIRFGILSDARKSRIQELVRRAANGEVVRVETSVRDANGEIAYIDFTITPVFDNAGQVYLLLPEARDITGRYIAEQRRSEYERRYDALFRNTADAVFIIGLDGRIITVNQRALEMLRCEMNEIIGKDMSTYIVDDEVADSMQILQRLSSGEMIPPVYLRKMRRFDGEAFTGEVNAMLVRDANNRAMYIQSMVRDISERQKLEQQQFELRLQRARANLLQHFIDEASHHFRTPIANIKTSNYLLPRFSGNAEKQQEHHRTIGRELQRLENLLDDLLMITRLQKDDSEYNVTPVITNRILAEVRSYYEGREKYTEHQWKWEYAEQETIVLGEKQLLSRAIINIIDNAIRYTPAGGYITIRNFERDFWTVIEIRDTGIGIPQEDQAHIFGDFYRGEEAMSRDSTGSGLGLSISQQIIERHRGAIRLNSTAGMGTSFQIILPINRSWELPRLPIPAYLIEPTTT